MTPSPEPTELSAVAFLRDEIGRTPMPRRRWRVGRRGLMAKLVSMLAAIPATIVILIGASNPSPVLEACRTSHQTVAARSAPASLAGPVMLTFGTAARGRAPACASPSG